MAYPQGKSVTSSPSAYRGFSAELCTDVDEVLLQEPLLASDLFQVLWLVPVLLCLPVQHLQHGLQLVLCQKGQQQRDERAKPRGTKQPRPKRPELSWSRHGALDSGSGWPVRTLSIKMGLSLLIYKMGTKPSASL